MVSHYSCRRTSRKNKLYIKAITFFKVILYHFSITIQNNDFFQVHLQILLFHNVENGWPFLSFHDIWLRKILKIKKLFHIKTTHLTQKNNIEQIRPNITVLHCCLHPIILPQIFCSIRETGQYPTVNQVS